MRNELIPSDKAIDHHPTALLIHFKPLNIHLVLRSGPKLFEVIQHNLHHSGNRVKSMCTFI